jgi:hypothetical protein
MSVNDSGAHDLPIVVGVSNGTDGFAVCGVRKPRNESPEGGAAGPGAFTNYDAVEPVMRVGVDSFLEIVGDFFAKCFAGRWVTAVPCPALCNDCR